MSSCCFLFVKEKNSSLQEHVKEIVKADRLDKVGKGNEKKTTGTLNWVKQNWNCARLNSRNDMT